MRKTDQTGFSVIEALLVLVIVSILGFTGWFVYHAQQTASKDLSSNNSTDPTYKKKANATALADPYAGWKQNCSSAGNACFKYLSDWTSATAESSDPTVPGLLLTSPSGNIKVAYDPVLQGLGGACQPGVCSIDILSIDTPPAPSSSNLRVIKAVFMNTGESSFTPMYCVTDMTYLSDLKLKLGKQDIGLVYFTFKNPKVDHIESLCVNPPVAILTTFKSENDVTTWLSSDEAAIGGKVLKSIDLQ